MEKTIKLSSKPKIMKTDKIETILFYIIFPTKLTLEQLPYVNLLGYIISTSSKDYPNQDDYRYEAVNLLVSNIRLTYEKYIDNVYLFFSFEIPRENLLNDYNIEESFKFSINSLFHANIIDGKFDDEKFNYEKEYLYSEQEKRTLGIYNNNLNEFLKIIDPNHEFALPSEDIYEIYKSITNEDLYKFYQDNILNNNYLSYVYGKVDENKINYLFDKYAPKQDKEEISITIDYFRCYPMREYSYQEIQTKFTQSELDLLYQVESMNDDEEFYLELLGDILKSSENNLIFEALRIKNHLVYNCRVTKYISRGILGIQAYIPNSKVQETIDAINEVFDELHNPKFLSECMKKSVKGYEIALKKNEDELYSDINYISNKDLHLNTLKRSYEHIKEIKVDDLIKFLDKIKLTTICFFRGKNND